jgi:hypothetical protein
VRLELVGHRELRLDGGRPVRAASAIARLGDGWLIAQDDATHAVWRRPTTTTAVRVMPPVDGHDTFSAAAGTKHLKPDLEAACEVTVDGRRGVLLLGSGSTPARMRASLVLLEPAGPRFVAADLTPLYQTVARTMGIDATHLNLEGACRHGDRLRWFQRGNAAVGAPSASVDVDLAALLDAVGGNATATPVAVGHARRYDLGRVAGVALGVTDAVAMPGGRTLVSAAAEDTPNAVDDGPVVGAALALLEGDRVVDRAALPPVGGTMPKVEGLALGETTPDGLSLLAVVDVDDPDTASLELTLRVRW